MMDKVIVKRTLNGDKDHIFTSPYHTSHKYAVSVFIPETETHLAAVARSTFKTKKECTEWNPKHGGHVVGSNARLEFEKDIKLAETLN